MRLPASVLALLLALAAGAGRAQASDAPPPARSYLPGLSAGEFDAVVGGQGLVMDAKADGGYRFLAKTPGSRRLIDCAEEEAPEILIGTLFLLPLEAFREVPPALVDRLLDVGSLSGVTYYSETRKKVTVLLDDVYRVDAPGSKTRAPALALGAGASSAWMVFHARDVNFGSCWYSMLVEREGRELLVTLTNERPLGFALFRAFGTRNLEMRFALVPVREGLLVEGLCLGNPDRAVYAFVDVYSAVEKRMRALQGWILGRAAELRGGKR